MINIYTVLTFAAMFLYILSILSVMKTYRSATPLLGWLVGLAFFVLTPLAAIVFNGGYQFPDYYNVSAEWSIANLDEPYFFYGFIVTWASLVLTALIVFIFMNSQKSIKPICITHPYRRAFYIISFLVIISLIFRLSIYGGVEKYFLHSWYLRDLDYVNSFGKVFVLFQYFEIALQILLSALSAQILTSPIKKTKKIWLSIWLLFLMIINVFFSGNRIYFALLIIYLGCFLLLKRHYKKIIKLAIVMPFVLLFFSLWTSLRADLGNPSETYKKYVENISNDDQASMSFIANITELSNVMLLIRITNDYGGKYDFLYGATYSRALTFIVPRSLYVNRPENFSKIIAEKYEPGADTSLSSTVIGEMYANFGIFSIVLLPTFTALVCFINRRYAKFLNSKPLTNITFFMFFVWLSRSTFSENFIAFSVAYFLIIALKIEKKSNESLVDTNSPLKCDLSR